MKGYTELKRLLDLAPSPDVDAACRYLEQVGQRFCIDYGTHSAKAKARQALIAADCGVTQ